MRFNLIDFDTWKRKEYFNHYFSDVPCTYSMTVDIDISQLKKCDAKLYPTMLYLLTSLVNKYEEFRTALDYEGNVGIFSEMYPCYTVFHKDSETFSNMWTEFNESYDIFCSNYNEDIEKYGSIKSMNAKPNVPSNTFPVSMIPWTTFTGFNLNLKKGYEYLLPIFTIGKYYEKENKVLMPIVVQVHHAVCDGFHVSRFINELQDLISRFEN